jgi:hypothetical protein
MWEEAICPLNSAIKAAGLSENRTAKVFAFAVDAGAPILLSGGEAAAGKLSSLLSESRAVGKISAVATPLKEGEIARRAVTGSRTGVPSPRNPDLLLGERGVPGQTGYIEPWSSKIHANSRGSEIVIDRLPGTDPLPLDRPLSTKELASLSRHYDEVEFGTVWKKINGRGSWYLESGEPGQWGEMLAHWADEPNVIMGPHTQPAGLPMSTRASMEDWNTLDRLTTAQAKAGVVQQKAATVVTSDGQVFRFNLDYSNTRLKTYYKGN